MKNKYTNKEYLNMYDNYKSLCVNKISQVVSYSNWSDEFVKTELKSLYDKLIKEFKNVDFTAFTEEELKELDFKGWDDDIILAPIWALDCISKGTKMSSISGDDLVYDGGELDKDVRMGVTAYGFNKKQIRESKIDRVLED